MVALKEFKKMMVDLSILTGKSPTCYGNKATDDKQLDYMIEVYHREIKGNDINDITNAFKDRRLRDEISAGFGLNVNVIEKYILIHKNRRSSSEEKKMGDFKYDAPEDCKKALSKMGIDIGQLADDKSLD